MLLSMTGFGTASHQAGDLSVSVEIRTVNNRYLKVSCRSSESVAGLDARIERVLRERIGRGTVTVAVRIDRTKGGATARLNGPNLLAYWDQLGQLAHDAGASPPADLSALLGLPGVAAESAHETDDEKVWQAVETALVNACDKLEEFRLQEGEAMAADLRSLCTTIDEHRAAVQTRAPGVVRDYRDRLRERLSELLDGTSVALDEGSLLREVSLYAERSDVNEELTRLGCHIEQFRGFIDARESMGRKMEFVCQEMFRETNTIGSKANDLEIARAVVEMKSAIEKIREIVQNIE